MTQEGFVGSREGNGRGGGFLSRRQGKERGFGLGGGVFCVGCRGVILGCAASFVSGAKGGAGDEGGVVLCQGGGGGGCAGGGGGGEGGARVACGGDGGGGGGLVGEVGVVLRGAYACPLGIVVFSRQLEQGILDQ